MEVLQKNTTEFNYKICEKLIGNMRATQKVGMGSSNHKLRDSNPSQNFNFANVLIYG